jgi:AcrR family transcriptional regulator
MSQPQPAQRRAPLTRERVVRAAIALADESGIESLSMRKLGHALGVEAMSLYNHVANKEEILDGMVDVLVSEINDAVTASDSSSGDWKAVMRRRILTAREILLRHRWAPGVMESRTNMSMPMLGYYDSVIGILGDAGFSIDLIHHTLHVLGSRILGFTQELYEDSEDLDPGALEMFIQQMAGTYPHLTEMARQISHDEETTMRGCDDQFEFEFALDLILDGLERLRAAA